MLRFYYKFIAHVFLMLCWTKIRVGGNPRLADIVSNLNNTDLERHLPEFNNAVSYVLRNVTVDTDESLDDLLTVFEKKLTNVVSNANDKDLIDAVVEILKLPNASNVLSGGTIDKLRKAILLPQEITKLKLAVESDRSCSHCGHKFTFGEIAVFQESIVPGSVASFVCTHCRVPAGKACNKCNKMSHFSQKFLSTFTKYGACSSCEAKKNDKDVADVANVEENVEEAVVVERNIELVDTPATPANQIIFGTYLNAPNRATPRQRHRFEDPEYRIRPNPQPQTGVYMGIDRAQTPFWRPEEIDRLRYTLRNDNIIHVENEPTNLTPATPAPPGGQDENR